MLAAVPGCVRSLRYELDESTGVPFRQIGSFADRVRPAMLVIGERADGSRYGGNAIAIAPNLILTAEHVGDDTITHVAGMPTRGELVADGDYPEAYYDDWALLRIEPPVPEEWVVPLGPEPDVGDAVSIRGVVTSTSGRGESLFAPFEAFGRVADAGWLRVDDPRTLVIDQPAWHSLSGSPVLDLQGRLVGVVMKAQIVNRHDGTIARRLPREEIGRALEEFRMGELVVPESRIVPVP